MRLELCADCHVSTYTMIERFNVMIYGPIQYYKCNSFQMPKNRVKCRSSESKHLSLVATMRLNIVSSFCSSFGGIPLNLNFFPVDIAYRKVFSDRKRSSAKAFSGAKHAAFSPP
ncbi:hypothetical protein KFK09_022516 [Dendrobium nobile]|uniref:Uncharacterized protein n=1 Tax=Dendrobium nobile TaxID=94219 RepID=A0A8T3AIT0_DENNO|nr:hypothetical protein KFK09_022516 [Dendrobium nobile]